MMIIRPAKIEDIDDLVRLADRSGFGLTSLPKDRDLLTRRIGRSLDAFSRTPEDRKASSFLFVLEDAASGRVVGTGGLVNRVGMGEPFYAYRVETHIHDSKTLGVRKEIPCLHLLKIRKGPCEIGGLFLDPDFQGQGHGRLLSLSRFLFLVEHRDLFPSKVIAEMRGMINDQGCSPFWEAVGRKFFDTDFPRADYLSVRDTRFIAELMPTHPIYIPLLPEEARSAIGKVHDRTRPALKMLREEGFEDAGMVDIFDAGLIIQCDVKKVRTVKDGRKGRFLGTGDPGEDTDLRVLSKGAMGSFRATISPGIIEEPGGVRLPPDVAEGLGLETGETVRYLPLKVSIRDHRGLV
jgi:arginine N-succinyltransferase